MWWSGKTVWRLQATLGLHTVPPESICMHACIPRIVFLNPSSLASQLARPPSDLSFEAETMFTRKPQWNKLVVCSQPSVEPQFTPRWERRRKALRAVGEQAYSLCPVFSGVWGVGGGDAKKTLQPAIRQQPLQKLGFSSGARCSFVVWLLYGTFER